MKYVVYTILLRFDASCFLLPLLSKKQRGNKLFIPEKKDTEVLFLNNTILLLLFLFSKKIILCPNLTFPPMDFIHRCIMILFFFSILET